MLDAGKYRAHAVNSDAGYTAKGTEQIVLTFELHNDKRSTITHYRYLSDAALEYTLKDLRTIGWIGDDVGDFAKGLPSGCDREVELVIHHEEFEGKTHARVRFVNAVGGVALKNAMAPDQAKAFGARMKGKIAALDAVAGRKVEPKAAATVCVNNDDIPF
jgi:hypothetical protein